MLGRALAAITLVAIAVAPLPVQRNCRKGSPWGNTCIAANTVCRVGSGSATRAADPPPAPPNVTTAGASPLGLANASALAERSNPRIQWVANRRGSLYYRNGCAGATSIPPVDRLDFRTEAELRRIGFAPATDRENACDAAGLAWHRALLGSASAWATALTPDASTDGDSSWVASIADGAYFRRSRVPGC